MSTKTHQERDEAIAALREIVQPGDTLLTVLRHVSSSGMTRWIDVYKMQENEPRWLSRYASRVTPYHFDERREAVKLEGCGMDMGFELVYCIAQAMFPDGFDCIGDRCPSNDHSNGDRDYTPHHHHSGGYALRQRWL